MLILFMLALQILHCTVNDLAQKVSSYVTIMTTLRTSTLAHVPGKSIFLLCQSYLHQNNTFTLAS